MLERPLEQLDLQRLATEYPCERRGLGIIHLQPISGLPLERCAVRSMLFYGFYPPEAWQVGLIQIAHDIALGGHSICVTKFRG